MSHEAIESYARLLDEERAACLTADFSKLEQILERKENLHKILKDLPPKNWERLIDRINRNQALLSSAMAGIKNARDRANGIKPNNFLTYSENGKIVENGNYGQFERKA